HRDHALPLERARDTALIVLEIVPLVATQPADVAVGAETVIALGARLLFAGEQARDDVLAVDEGIAVVPGANVVNFDLARTLAPVEIGDRRSQHAARIFRPERRHRDHKTSL